MRSGQFTNEALVQRRQAARVCFATVALGLASLLTNMVRQVPDSPVALQKVGAAGPFILVAVMPRHLPPAYTRLVAVSMCIFIALDTRTTVRRWKETADEEAVPVRALRCAVPAINVLNAARVMMYTLWTNGSQFWFALRSANVSNSIARIVAVLLLKESDVAPDSFPPGKMSYEGALRFNVLCLVYSALMLSPPCRRWISRLTGITPPPPFADAFAPLPHSTSAPN